MAIAAFAVLSLWLFPQTSSAEPFTSQDVLNWSAENQNFYFETSVMMAGIIASQNSKVQATCIDNWYFSGASNRATNNTSILTALRKFKGYHPGGVVLAVVQKQCGPLKFTK